VDGHRLALPLLLHLLEDFLDGPNRNALVLRAERLADLDLSCSLVLVLVAVLVPLHRERLT